MVILYSPSLTNGYIGSHNLQQQQIIDTWTEGYSTWNKSANLLAPLHNNNSASVFKVLLYTR